jgi:hypothetical protein
VSDGLQQERDDTRRDEQREIAQDERDRAALRSLFSQVANSVGVMRGTADFLKMAATMPRGEAHVRDAAAALERDMYSSIDLLQRRGLL